MSDVIPGGSSKYSSEPNQSIELFEKISYWILSGCFNNIVHFVILSFLGSLVKEAKEAKKAKEAEETKEATVAKEALQELKCL